MKSGCARSGAASTTRFAPRSPSREHPLGDEAEAPLSLSLSQVAALAEQEHLGKTQARTYTTEEAFAILAAASADAPSSEEEEKCAVCGTSA